MIFRYQVETIARSHLVNTLKEYPGVTKRVLEPWAFGKFVDLCTERCNQLDVAGYVRSKHAMHDFIKKATTEYALVRIGILDKDQARLRDEMQPDKDPA
jgi:hypothetical protein